MIDFVFAHPGEPLSPHDLWTAWTLEPSLLIPLAVMVLAYLWGVRRVWQRAGAGHGITRRSGLRFVGGILAVIVALVSPLDALSGSLFSAHMVQHLLLMLVAAPLLAASDFPLALVWALPRRWAQALAHRLNRWPGLLRAWRVISHPVTAWLLFTIAMWGWHVPSLYQAALRNETIHVVEHITFLVTGMLFWLVLVKPSGPAYARYGLAIPYLFATGMQSGIFGALMTMTDQPWYPFYASLTAPWGLTPLQDQQLAGVIMWVPGGLLFTLLTIIYFAVWLRALEKRSVRL